MRWIKFTRSVVVPPNFFTFGSFQWKADISNVLLLKCNGFTLCHGWGTKGCWYDSKFYIHVWVVLHHLEIKYRSSHRSSALVRLSVQKWALRQLLFNLQLCWAAPEPQLFSKRKESFLHSSDPSFQGQEIAPRETAICKLEMSGYW